MENIWSILENFKKKGYLFHGNKKKLELLLPYPTDNQKIPFFGKLKLWRAVCATPFPEYAYFFAILPKGQISYRAHVSYSSGSFVFYCSTTKFSPGYIYVLPRAPFKKHSFTEYRSKKPVKPLHVLRVKPEPFLKRFTVRPL